MSFSLSLINSVSFLFFPLSLSLARISAQKFSFPLVKEQNWPANTLVAGEVSAFDFSLCPDQALVNKSSIKRCYHLSDTAIWNGNIVTGCLLFQPPPYSFLILTRRTFHCICYHSKDMNSPLILSLM